MHVGVFDRLLGISLVLAFVVTALNLVALRGAGGNLCFLPSSCEAGLRTLAAHLLPAQGAAYYAAVVFFMGDSLLVVSYGLTLLVALTLAFHGEPGARAKLYWPLCLSPAVAVVADAYENFTALGSVGAAATLTTDAFVHALTNATVVKWWAVSIALAAAIIGLSSVLRRARNGP
jgi:hypothetical protein